MMYQCALCAQSMGNRGNTTRIVDREGVTRTVHTWCAIDYGYKLTESKHTDRNSTATKTP